MPYIPIGDRRKAIRAPMNSGELNFAITKLLVHYLRRQGLNYHHINDCLGALDGARLEFYQRVVMPYEQRKRAEHGDVY